MVRFVKCNHSYKFVEEFEKLDVYLTFKRKYVLDCHKSYFIGADIYLFFLRNDKKRLNLQIYISFVMNYMTCRGCYKFNCAKKKL